MIKKMIDKLNPIVFAGCAMVVTVGVLIGGIIHVISGVFAIGILLCVCLIAAVVLNIKSIYEARKRRKAQDSAYLSLKNKTIQEIAELANLDAGEAAAYSKLQDATLFDLFAIAKRAEEGKKND
jgi:ABC-type transport system involved in cytochrome bd biosynthesis fused ATPase/permease subunit